MADSNPPSGNVWLSTDDNGNKYVIKLNGGVFVSEEQPCGWYGYVECVHTAGTADTYPSVTKTVVSSARKDYCKTPVSSWYKENEHDTAKWWKRTWIGAISGFANEPIYTDKCSIAAHVTSSAGGIVCSDDPFTYKVVHSCNCSGSIPKIDKKLFTSGRWSIDSSRYSDYTTYPSDTTFVPYGDARAYYDALTAEACCGTPYWVVVICVCNGDGNGKTDAFVEQSDVKPSGPNYSDAQIYGPYYDKSLADEKAKEESGKACTCTYDYYHVFRKCNKNTCEWDYKIIGADTDDITAPDSYELAIVVKTKDEANDYIKANKYCCTPYYYVFSKCNTSTCFYDATWVMIPDIKDINDVPDSAIPSGYTREHYYTLVTTESAARAKVNELLTTACGGAYYGFYWCNCNTYLYDVDCIHACSQDAAETLFKTKHTDVDNYTITGHYDSADSCSAALSDYFGKSCSCFTPEVWIGVVDIGDQLPGWGFTEDFNTEDEANSCTICKCIVGFRDGNARSTCKAAMQTKYGAGTGKYTDAGIVCRELRACANQPVAKTTAVTYLSDTPEDLR